jgi:NifU-like protein involved in Fe-S cluster formation
MRRIKGFDFAFQVTFEQSMADDLNDPLYHRELLRLAADAHGAGRLVSPDATASLHNPACGDRVTVELTLAGGHIAALAHVTQACVLTQASAALLSGTARGRDAASLAALADSVMVFLKGGPTPPNLPKGYDVFDGVIGHAGRHVCVMLPLKAALKALESAR